MSMIEPLVSVIIPVYTGSRLLKRAIDSALQQDVPLEVIVVNDETPDNSMEIVQRYVDAAGAANVHVMRGGQELTYEQVISQ